MNPVQKSGWYTKSLKDLTLNLHKGGLFFLFLLLTPALALSQEVVLSFDEGFLGDENNGGNGCVNCDYTSNLGITELRFGQVNNTGQFTAQGNDITGFVRFLDSNGTEFEIPGNIQYRITTQGNLRAFGFVPQNTSTVTIQTDNGPFNVYGNSQDSGTTPTSTFGFILEGQTVTISGGSISGNAASNGLLDALNNALANQADFSINDVTINETAGTATLTVTLDPSATEERTVDYTTLNSTAQAGSDYTPVSGTLTFPASTTTQTIEITIIDDTIDESDEIFLVQLSNPTGGSGITDNEGTVTILDNDTQQNESLTLTLTQRNCWRFLSSPFQNLSYNDIVGQLWTQGATGSDYPAANFSNIYLWDKSTTNNSTSGWTTNGLDLETGGIPEGEGFLISVFEDDNFNGTIETSEAFDKSISVTGTPHPSDASISPTMNTNANGWTLVGNPFEDPIDFGAMITTAGQTTRLTDVAYVYDVTGPSTDDTNGNPGGWVTTNGDYGDISNNRIAVFQGFLVQNDGTVTSGNTSNITFNADSRTTEPAEFYGKQNDEQQFVRLQIKGMNTTNSAWISFSEDGSEQKMKGDALELLPYHEQYTLLGTQKGEEILDIGQFPLRNNLEIPLYIETTNPGQYTLSATDLNFIGDAAIVLVDHETNQKITLHKDSFYSFEVFQAEKSKADRQTLHCGLNGIQSVSSFYPQKAKQNDDGVNRFSILVQANFESRTEIPSEIRLYQNYPNPFNPTTQISYSIPQQSDVLLEVYDLTGKLITTLVNESKSSGTHNVTLDATTLSSGVYMYRIQTMNQVFSRKLTVIK